MDGLHVVAALLLTWGAFKAYDQLSPGYPRLARYGWHIKAALAIAAFWLALFVLPIPWSHGDDSGEPNYPVAMEP